MNNIFMKIEKNMNKGIALFGAGQNGKWSLDYLLKNGHNVPCFIDNDSELSNTSINNIPVYSYAEFLKINSGYPILITAKHAVIPIIKDLTDYKLKMPFDAWFYLKNKKKIDETKQYFIDKKSKMVLNSIIKTMLSGDEKYCAKVAEGQQYFCLPNFLNKGGEVFVDLGAYVGDTVEKFICSQNGSYKHIYAFEPSISQFNAAELRFKRLINEWALDCKSISLIKAGVGSKTSVMYINSDAKHLISTTVLPYKQEGCDKIEGYALDDFFKEIQISFVKVDIEGSEFEMLKGFKKIIKRDKPKFALSVYHRPDDLFNCIKLLKECVPDYRFALRQHSPILVDTTLYCWIE